MSFPADSRKRLLTATSSLSMTMSRSNHKKLPQGDSVTQAWIVLYGGNSEDSSSSSPSPSPSLPMDEFVIRSTQEALRLLKTKLPVGALQKGDREDVRAAILLDLVRRNTNTCQPRASEASAVSAASAAAPLLPMNQKLVAQKLCVKFSDFEHLHHVISNYYHEQLHQQQKQQPQRNQSQKQQKQPGTSAAAVPSLASLKKRGPLLGREDEPSQQQSQQQVQRPRRSSTVTAALTGGTLDANTLFHPPNGPSNNILPMLVIRLALYVRDPASTLQKTMAALHEFVQYTMQQCSKLSASETRGQRYDLTRYWPAYQACMLYHVVVDVNVAATAANSGNSKRGDAHSIPTHQQQQQHQHEDEANTVLKLEDLVQASSGQFTYLVLKEKLFYVQQWAKETRKKTAQNNAAIPPATLKRQRRQQEQEQPNPSDMAASNSKTKRSKSISTFVTAESMLPPTNRTNEEVDQDDVDSEDVNHHLQERRRRRQVQKQFDTWKTNVVEAACSQCRQPQAQTNQKNTVDNLLELAANQVLQKYGLLS